MTSSEETDSIYSINQSTNNLYWHTIQSIQRKTENPLMHYLRAALKYLLSLVFVVVLFLLFFSGDAH